MSQVALRHPDPRTGALGAVVLLAGGLAPSPLARASGQSVLDLHVSASRTLLDCWAEALGETGSDCPAPVLLHSPDVPRPRMGRASSPGFQVRTDLSAYRGPAGAVRDACAAVPGEDLVLVAEAHRYHGPSLERVFARQAAEGADIVIVANSDHTPAGVYLMRREVLDLVPPVGYLDLKEQLLGKAMASGFRVAIEEYGQIGSFPVRTRADLLRAAAAEAHRGDHGWQPSLSVQRVVVAEQTWPSVVAPGAAVADDAVLVESVVMPGAVVGPGAIVVRSVLCGGAEVGAGASCVERVVGPSGPVSDAQAAVPWSTRRRRG